MAEIFRKSSLEKLSSPEQLDRMIVITSPTLWLSLIGAAGIIIVALLWAIFGRLPVEVDACGIYVNRAGVQTVYAQNGGVISEILVADGDEVKKGDIIALLDSEEIDNTIQEYEERIAAVEAVTLDSEDDVCTADNKSLMDVKNQRNIDDKPEVISKQFYATKESILNQLENECEQYQRQREQTVIRASADGIISNISVMQGSVLVQGSEVAKIQMGDASDRVVVCYIPVGSGKKIQEGMEVLVYPSTVNKEEYGHMKASVISVDDYVTSTENMLKRLGDNNLVEVFLQNGPVVEVVCELEKSGDTVSGYYWSSRKGASVAIDAGTMVDVSVVTEEKAPITMLIPSLDD